MTLLDTEPSLKEIMDDDIMRAVLERDGNAYEEVWDHLQAVRRSLLERRRETNRSRLAQRRRRAERYFAAGA